MERVANEPGPYVVIWIAEALGRLAAKIPNLRETIIAVIRERLDRAIGFDRVALRAILDRLGVE